MKTQSKFKNSCGYYFVKVEKDHPLAIPMHATSYAFEHQLVVWEALDEDIDLQGMNVHHRNEKRDDNRLENLIVFKNGRGDHRSYHHTIKRGNTEAQALSYIGLDNLIIFDKELEREVRWEEKLLTFIRKFGVETKQCTRCGNRNPLENFHNQPNNRDGKDSWCKPCVKVRYSNA